MNTPTAPTIDHVIVVVPAHNEQELVGASVRSLETAAAQVGPRSACTIALVADACTDATTSIAQRAFQGSTHLVALVNHHCAGAARRTGVAAALAGVDADPERTWIASTDADTIVPPSWLRDQIKFAAQGIDAVAGIVTLLDDHNADPAIVDSFTDYYKLGPDGSHAHVHAANLGVRASAYLAVGGWNAIGTGEDHDLWNRLRRAGYKMKSPTSLAVATSARRTSRVEDGFARDLAALDLRRQLLPRSA